MTTATRKRGVKPATPKYSKNWDLAFAVSCERNRRQLEQKKTSRQNGGWAVEE